jgi:hypothetical protein
LGSSVSITEANGCTNSGHCSSLTQSGPFHTAMRSGRFAGYAGPSRRPAAEAISKYILVDMYAKAVQGMAPADAVKWAHGKLVKDLRLIGLTLR